MRSADLLFDPVDRRMPRVCDVVYGTVVVNPEGEIAVLYWARSQGFGIPLVLLDYEVVTFADMTWTRVDAELEELRQSCGARLGKIGLFIENAAVAQHVAASGIPAVEIPSMLSAPAYWEALNLAAAFHIGAGTVKATERAFEKAARASTTDALNRRVLAPLAPNYRMAPRDDDPTTPAWLYGIVIGLDETAGRSVIRAKKAPKSSNGKR